MPPLLLGVVEVVVVIIGWCWDWGVVIIIVKRRGVGWPPLLDNAGGGNGWDRQWCRQCGEGGLLLLLPSCCRGLWG